jgi:hypothetical protein
MFTNTQAEPDEAPHFFQFSLFVSNICADVNGGISGTGY